MANPDRGGPTSADHSAGGYTRLADDVSAADRREDQRRMTSAVVVMASGFALVATLQAILLLSGQPGQHAAVTPGDVSLRLVLNVAVVATAALTASTLRIQEHPPRAAVLLVLGGAAIVTMTRAVLRLVSGIYADSEAFPVLVDNVVAFAVTVLVFALALRITRAQQRVRHAERTSVLPATIATDALIRMQRDELRQRYTDADTLRRMLEDRTERLRADLDDLAVELVGRRAHIQLEAARRDLDEMIEQGLTSLTNTVYPAGIEQGIVTALRALARRVPDTVHVDVTFDDEIRRLESSGAGPLTREKRLLLVRLAEEGISNALRHGHALRIDISLGLENGLVRMVISDAGRGVQLPTTMRTLGKLRTKIELLDGRVYLGTRPGGGTRLALILPVGATRPSARKPNAVLDGVARRR